MEVEKTAIITFGRFQPPTRAHEYVFQQMKEFQSTIPNSLSVVFLSQKEDNKKNPISPKMKQIYMSELFPFLITLSIAEIIDPFKAVHYLAMQNYKHIHFFCGEDRIPKFKDLLNYVDPQDGYQHLRSNVVFPVIKTITLHSTGPRDEYSENPIEYTSGSLAREFAVKGNFDMFKAMLPTSCKSELAEEIYNDIRSVLLKNEQTY
jgi:hypothetical protein